MKRNSDTTSDLFKIDGNQYVQTVYNYTLVYYVPIPVNSRVITEKENVGVLCEFGKPDEFIPDNGPQYNRRFYRVPDNTRDNSVTSQ